MLRASKCVRGFMIMYVMTCEYMLETATMMSAHFRPIACSRYMITQCCAIHAHVFFFLYFHNRDNVPRDEPNIDAIIYTQPFRLRPQMMYDGGRLVWMVVRVGFVRVQAI